MTTPPNITPHPPPEETPHSISSAARQRLSSLADGDTAGLDAQGGVSAALATWRTDADARQAWHSYHLIGDVMRSEDLAHTATQDLAFMSRLRDRLEAETLHLLPAGMGPDPGAHPGPRAGSQAGTKHAGSVKSWPTGLALAASVAVAAIALGLSRPWTPASPDGARLLARAGNPGAAAPTLAVNGAGVLRDPRLDEFLRLHQMARGGLPVSAPGGTLQRADMQMPAAGPNR